MYGRRKDTPSGNTGSPEPGAPWSVRAEFTIRRGDERSSPVEAANRSATIAPTTESSGVLMTYTFTPSRSQMSPSTSTTASQGAYGFQRGNLLFTSTPPARSLLPVRSHTIPRSAYPSHEYHEYQQQPGRPSLPDSGYNSEQPASRQSSDKRCRSTYSIFLSTAGNRTVQQPYPRPWSSYAQRQQQQQVGCCRFSAVPEVCEDCAEAASGGRPFASHFCTKLGDRGVVGGRTAPVVSSKDAASQTTDIEAKLSPVAARRKVKRRNTGALSGSSGRDELKSNNFGRLSKPAASVKSPTPPAEQTVSDSSASNTTASTRDDNSEKRKRTVHIDVYCTGTDDDPNEEDSSSASNSSADDDDNQTQTTVFESTDVRVTHTQARSGVLPRGFQDEKAFLRRATERRCESFKHVPMRMPSLASSKGYESDDVLSSLYPSQFSSYSRLRDFESSVLWSAASSSVGLAPEEYDSASATSWKDTVSDMESLIHSKSSITPCDSFEYADSLDRERIRRMEAVWSRKTAIKPKNWRSAQADRRHQLQGKMMREYAEKHPTGWSESESSAAASESEGSAEEVGWSFLSSENNSVVRGKLILPSLPGGGVALVERTNSSRVVSASTTDQETSQAELIKEVKTSIFRDRIGPFGSTSPSSTPSKLQSRMTSPFTTPQGERTDHIIKASIFGRVVSTFKKPGHHVGPAKNPACSCEHCRRYFEENARGRSRSLDNTERRDSSRAPSSTN